jgi:hypothetical protein
MDMVAVLPFLLRQLQVRDAATGRTYTLTGVTDDGQFVLSRSDCPADRAVVVKTLDGFGPVKIVPNSG